MQLKGYPSGSKDQDVQAHRIWPVELEYVSPDKPSEKRLLFRIDCWVLPVLTILFILSFLDKVNIANAKIYGLTKDLKLKNTEYNTALVILFVAYVLFDIPFTILLRHVKPHIWLSVCTFFFGLISMSQGFVTSFSGLLAARFFLGIAEAGSFSCCFYVIGMWYKRQEAQKRFTFFYSSVQLGGAFAGLLASAIGNLQGRGGYATWQWIFIIEGGCTAALSLPFFFIIPDFPSQTTWLLPAEKALLLSRLHEDKDIDPSAVGTLNLRTMLRILCEPKILLGGLMYFTFVIPGYAYSYFAPSIIKTYTASAIHAQLLSVPPWACGFVAAMTVAYLSDRAGHRFLFATAPMVLAIAALGILLTVHDRPHIQYGALFLLLMGIWTALPVQICWFSMNVVGHARKSIALGWQIGFGNAGGIVAVYLFLDKDAPEYIRGYAVVLGFIVLTMLLNCVYAGVCWRENKAKDRLTGSGSTDQELGSSVCEVKDDRSLGFRNML